MEWSKVTYTNKKLDYMSYSKKSHLRRTYLVDSKAMLKNSNPVLNNEIIRLLLDTFFLEYLILK